MLLERLKIWLKGILLKRKLEIINSKYFFILKYFIANLEARKLKDPKIKNNKKEELYKKTGRTWQILRYSRFGTIHELNYKPPIYSVLKEETFSMQLKVLMENFSVISLSDLVKYLDNNEDPPLGTIVVTIDDGYESAYFKALPSLINYSCPACFSIYTAYIGSKLPFWETLLKDILETMANNKVKLNALKCIDEQKNNLLLSSLPDNKLPTEETFLNLVGIFISIPPNTRLKILNELEQIILQNELPLNFPKDFMDWDQIDDIKKSGFEVISKLHSGIPITQLIKKEWLKHELETSLAILTDLNIPYFKTISLPLDLYFSKNLETLRELEVKYALGSEQSTYISDNNKTIILPRKFIFEGNTHNEALFLQRLLTA